MDVQVLSLDRISESGESLITLVQDQALSTLDLLVRESLQNSLDASKDRSPKTRVDVDFITGNFKSRDLSSELNYLENRLNARYPAIEYDFLAIRDSGTFGLTGTNLVSDDKSRLQSLVYHIGKKQSMEGSGGFWGMGKTTFYRVGIGLVVFYSRTFEEGEYCSKLAVAYVDGDMSNPLIVEDNSRGIAFFGQYDNEGTDNTIRSPTVPITDVDRIERFLRTFGIESYDDDKTGTTIVIPYVNFKKLLNETKPSQKIAEGRNPTWCSSIESYLSISIQRWYAPRLANPEYDGSWLKASINGKPIGRDRMHPLFHLISDLYNISSDNSYTSEFLQDFDVKTAPIRCKSIRGSIAGYVGAALVSPSALGLTNEYYRNAYSMVGEYNATLSSPIITFCRKPGMLIRYVTSNSSWVPRLKNSDDNKLLICVFKLASDRKIRDNDQSLEEYIRARERADHNNWENENTYGIVERISKNTSEELSKMFNVTVKNDCRTRSTLSEIFSDFFLPKKITANTCCDTESTGLKKLMNSGKRKGSGSKSRFAIDSSYANGGSRKVYFSFSSGAGLEGIMVSVVASGERGSADASEWESEFKTIFPISIKNLVLNEVIVKNGKTIEKNEVIDLSTTIDSLEDCVVCLMRSSMGSIYGVSFQGCKAGFTYKCSMDLSCQIESVSFEVKYETLRCKK